MNILITGSDGFIGKNMESFLLEKSLNVQKLDDDYFSEPNWSNELKKRLIKFSPNVIFHFGALTNTLVNDVNYMMERNFQSTKLITDYCTFNKIPLIFSSSSLCYGIDDDYPFNLYGWSKYTAEQYVINNNGIALRYFNVYGPHEENKKEMASFPFQFYNKHINNEKIELFPVHPRMDFVYIDDVISANYYALLNYDKFKGKFYDVGYGEARSFEDILNILELDFTYGKESGIRESRFFSCSNPEKWLPYWTPEFNLEDGLEKYKEYMENTYNKKPLD